jgi:hypothetical protein
MCSACGSVTAARVQEARTRSQPAACATVYTAATEQAARERFDEFAGKRESGALEAIDGTLVLDLKAVLDESRDERADRQRNCPGRQRVRYRSKPFA